MEGQGKCTAMKRAGGKEVTGLGREVRKAGYNPGAVSSPSLGEAQPRLRIFHL